MLDLKECVLCLLHQINFPNKTSIFNLRFPSHFCMDFYAANPLQVGNDILHIFLDYIVSKILKKRGTCWH